MKTRVLMSAAASAAFVLAGCGGPGKTVEKPTVAPPVRAESPGKAKFLAGQNAAAQGNWQEAAGLFAQAARLDSKMSMAVVNQGIALERSGDLKGAAEVYRKALVADSENPEAAANLGRVLIATNRLKQARQVTEDALAKNPEHPKLLNMLAGILRQQKKYKRAAATARKVLLRDQQNAAAIKTLALVYADQGQLQLAETFFRNALKLDPKDASVRVALGLIAYRSKEHQTALVEFEAALELDPNNAAALTNLGAIALRYRDYERAAKAYNDAAAKGMLNCNTASALGYALEGARQGEAAVAQLKKAYELCPREHELLFAMGNICMGQLRDSQCALEHFEAYKNTKKGLAADHLVHQYIESLKAQLESEQGGPETAPEDPNEAGLEEQSAEAPAPGEASQAIEGDEGVDDGKEDVMHADGDGENPKEG